MTTEQAFSTARRHSTPTPADECTVHDSTDETVCGSAINTARDSADRNNAWFSPYVVTAWVPEKLHACGKPKTYQGHGTAHHWYAAAG